MKRRAVHLIEFSHVPIMLVNLISNSKEVKLEESETLPKNMPNQDKFDRMSIDEIMDFLQELIIKIRIKLMCTSRFIENCFHPDHIRMIDPQFSIPNTCKIGILSPAHIQADEYTCQYCQKKFSDGYKLGSHMSHSKCKPR